MGDITYVPTDEGWLYVAARKDLFTADIVGFQTDWLLRNHIELLTSEFSPEITGITHEILATQPLDESHLTKFGETSPVDSPTSKEQHRYSTGYEEKCNKGVHFTLNRQFH